jgi:hypothetical protein
MPALTIKLEGDGAFAELQAAHGEGIVAPNDHPMLIAALERGMVGGRPSVALGIVLPDGRWVFAETSLRLFLTAADVLKARFGDPRD